MSDRSEVPTHLVEVAEKVRQALASIEWNAERAIALGNVLHIYGLEFNDGSLFNDDECGTGLTEAAMIVSVVCSNPVREWPDWKRSFSSGAERTEAYDGEFEAMVARLRASEVVRRVLDGSIPPK